MKGGIMGAVANLGSSISGTLKSVVVGSFMAAAAAGVAGFGALLAKGVIDSAAVEQTRISLETMLGSAQKADKLLRSMTAFAAKTPFELPGITGTSKVLLAFGMTQEQIMPTLKMLGDVAAGTGKDLQELGVIYGQIRAAGRLMGGDMLQLVNAGVPIIGTLAKQFGVAESEIKKMSEQGKISFADVEKAFQTMSGEGGLFFNMMERQSESLTGRFSTLKDSISLMAQEMVSVAMPAIKSMLEEMDRFVNRATVGISALRDHWNLSWDIMEQYARLKLSELLDYAPIWSRAMVGALSSGLTGLKGSFGTSALGSVAQAIKAAMDLTGPASAADIKPSAKTTEITKQLNLLLDALKKVTEAEQRAADSADAESAAAAAATGGAAASSPAAAATQAAMDTKAKIDDLLGFSGIADLGRRTQEIALQRSREAREQRMEAIAKESLRKQEEIVSAIRDGNSKSALAVLG